MLNRISLLTVVVALAATTILVLCSGPKTEVQATPVVQNAAKAIETVALDAAVLTRTQVELAASPTIPVTAKEKSLVEQKEQAFGWLYGNVLDIHSGEPFVGAKIFLDKGREGVVGFFGPFANGKSRIDGSFRMKVPVGVWRASIKIPMEKQLASGYQGQAPGMVHGTVEIFDDKDTPFSFLIDTSTKLTGAIFMKDNPVQTTLRMEVVRVVDQEVVAILNLLGDHRWTEEAAEAGEQPLTPNHGAFQLDFLGQYLYEIRVSPFYVDAPKDGPTWSIHADLTSGSLNLGQHGISYNHFFGPGLWLAEEPADSTPKQEPTTAPEMVWEVIGTRVAD